MGWCQTVRFWACAWWCAGPERILPGASRDGRACAVADEERTLVVSLPSIAYARPQAGSQAAVRTPKIACTGHPSRMPCLLTLFFTLSRLSIDILARMASK